MIAETKAARLLVVEDEVITARDLQDTLEELGYDVPDIASSGSEALDLVVALQPDIVLMDINLGAGERDGVEVASELRDRFRIPVIYLTAYADSATLSRASATAPLGYLTKPFDRLELHATIQMALVKGQLDQQLRQSESWFSTSLSSIGDGVIATDATGKVKFVNPVAEGLTGWSRAEAIGRPLEEVFSLFDQTKQTKYRSLSQRVLADGQTVSLEEGAFLRARSGEFVPVGDSAAPIRDQRDGSVLGVVIVFRDLTEKQQVAAELERARRLESLGTMAGGLAHDLNNILAIISGNIELATRAGASQEMQARALGNIDTALHGAKRLTGQFLTFSKGGEPICRPIDLRKMLVEEGKLALDQSGTAARGIEFRPEIAARLWPVSADESQIRRVLENLLVNAIQSLPATGGRIIARASNCPRPELPPAPAGGCAELCTDPFVKIEIIDSGCGISDENLPHVCEPYFTTRTTGSGLGLSVCHSIVRKHNGLLQIRSAAGAGTTAVVYLPADGSTNFDFAAADTESAVEMESPPIAPAEPKPVAAHFRVLVMDDEPLMRELLASMLEFLGHCVVTAATGEEALRLYSQAAAGEPFDAVCIDLVNKIGMGGQEMIGRVREIDPAAVCLVCSGYSDHPIMANYRAYGFNGCLPKPVSLDQLDAALRQAVCVAKAQAKS